MKRLNNLQSTCITALLCFGLGFIVSSSLSKNRVESAAEKAAIGQKAIDVVVNMRRHTFDLYRQIRDLKGRVTVVRLPARVITRYVPVGSGPRTRTAVSGSQIGRLASLAKPAVQAPSGTSLNRQFDRDRALVVDSRAKLSMDAGQTTITRQMPMSTPIQITKTSRGFYNRDRNHDDDQSDQNKDQNEGQNRDQNGEDGPVSIE